MWFTIDRVERHHKDTFPTAEVYGPTAGPELRLVTCGGPFDRRSRSYRDNVVVFASPRPPRPGTGPEAGPGGHPPGARCSYGCQAGLG